MHNFEEQLIDVLTSFTARISSTVIRR